MKGSLHLRGEGEGGGRHRRTGGGEGVAGVEREGEGGVLPVETLRVELGIGRGI